MDEQTQTESRPRVVIASRKRYVARLDVQPKEPDQKTEEGKNSANVEKPWRINMKVKSKEAESVPGEKVKEPPPKPWRINMKTKVSLFKKQNNHGKLLFLWISFIWQNIIRLQGDKINMAVLFWYFVKSDERVYAS